MPSRRGFCVATLCLTIACSVFAVTAPPAAAEITVVLSEARDQPTVQKFEVDLQLTFTDDLFNGDLEFVNLDIINSSYNGNPLTHFGLVQFQATAPFDDWQGGSQFGGPPGFESQVMLDAFASAMSSPETVLNGDPITIGTFTFNYQPLGLMEGDTVTLDVFGFDDGSGSRTTSVAFRNPADLLPRLVNPVFAPQSRTIVVSAVPEPFGILFLSAVSLPLIACRRRRQRSRVGVQASAARSLPSLTTAIAFLLLSMLASPTRADVLARFAFDGNNYTDDATNTLGANTGLNLSNDAPAIGGLTVTELLFSPGLDPSAALGFAANDFDNALGFSTDVNSDRDFSLADQTVFFRFSVAPGFAADLETFSFDSLKARGGNTTGARVTHTVFYDPAIDPAVDGLVGDLDFIVSRNHDHTGPGEAGAESTGGNFTAGRWSVDPIDLSSQTGLTGTHTIAIRSYASVGVDQDFGLDNLVLTGTVSAVPEPSTVFCITALSAGMLCRRKKRC
ncbi:hypothetical protein Pla52nx_001246 [Stieleria varia]